MHKWKLNLVQTQRLDTFVWLSILLMTAEKGIKETPCSLPKSNLQETIWFYQLLLIITRSGSRTHAEIPIGKQNHHIASLRPPHGAPAAPLLCHPPATEGWCEGKDQEQLAMDQQKGRIALSHPPYIKNTYQAKFTALKSTFSSGKYPLCPSTGPIVV